MSNLWWFYFESDTPNGPLKLEELISALKRKPNAGDIFVWQQGFKEWVKAAYVPELARLLVTPPPAAQQKK
jgi:GYF domain 2